MADGKTKRAVAPTSAGTPRVNVPPGFMRLHGSDIPLELSKLKAAFGSSEETFLNGFLSQLEVACSTGSAPDPDATAFAASIVKGIGPRDELEALLAAQMATVHIASMTFVRRLASVQTIKQQDSVSKSFNQLTRTFATQVEALVRYRSGGKQKVVVKHVHVHEGGQAIVGNVEGGRGHR